MKTLFITVGILLLTGNLYGQDYYMYVDGKKHRYKISAELYPRFTLNIRQFTIASLVRLLC